MILNKPHLDLSEQYLMPESPLVAVYTSLGMTILGVASFRIPWESLEVQAGFETNREELNTCCQKLFDDAEVIEMLKFLSGHEKLQSLIMLILQLPFPSQENL